MKKIISVLKWTAIVIGAAFLLLLIIRIPNAIDKVKTDEQVAKIHATKLTLDDVMGKNLPPDPGADADKTIAGIDENHNGIRDDVELAIFKAYPNSAKTRAVLLQYALALQAETTLPIVNEITATEVIREQDRSNMCVADTLVPRATPESGRTGAEVKRIDSYVELIESAQFNTKARVAARDNFYSYLRSYSSLSSVCDINPSLLPN